MQVSEFFTWQTLGSYAGAILAVWLLTNVTRYVLSFDARWLALAWAVVIQVAVWWAGGSLTAQALVLGVLNAFTVYAGAVGVSTITGKAIAPDTEMRAMTSSRRAWSSWY